MRPENDPIALRWRCLRHTAFSSRSDCVVVDPYWSVCDARDPITIRSPHVGCNLVNGGGVRMWSSMYNDQSKAKNFDIDFLVLISFVRDMVRCRTNIVVMYVKRGFPNYLLFVKTTIVISNKLCMAKLITTFSSWKMKLLAISMYKRWYKPGYCPKRTWNIITICDIKR